MCKKLLTNRRGSAIIIVSAAMVALIGFCSLVVDLGNLFLTKQRLNNALDAAVLAGSQELPAMVDNVQGQVEEYFNQNAAENFTLTSVSVSDDYRTVTATGQVTVQYFLARVLGITSTTINCTAAARIESLTAVKGVIPIGIQKQTLLFNQKYTLKISSDSDFDEFMGPGTFGVLQLGDSGASTYEENFKYGYNQKIMVGDVIATETGNKSGATRDGIEYRVSQCTHACTPTSFNPACPRVVIIPIYEPAEPENPIPGDKITKVRIVGFAAFLIDVPGDKTVGNMSYVDGYFVQMVIEGESDPGADNQGVYATRLIM